MKLNRRIAVVFCFALSLVFPDAGVAAAPFTLIHSIFDPNTNASPGEAQGGSVALHGGIAVVGSGGANIGAFRAGVARVYDIHSGSLLHTLTNPAPVDGGQFGGPLALSGTTLVVGALGNDVGVPYAGLVYAFDLASATPNVPILTLTNPAPAVGDDFGAALAIDGTRIVAGSLLDDDGFVDSGRAYVFDLASPTPSVPVLTLTNPAPAPNGYFACSVAISGTRVVVGKVNDQGGTGTGSAYVYELSSSNPAVPITKLTDPTPMVGDDFGWSVAISGSRVVVGEPADDTGQANSGTSFVFDLSGAMPGSPVLILTNPVPAGQALYGSSVTIDGPRVGIYAGRSDGSYPSYSRVDVYDLSSPAPSVPVSRLTNWNSGTVNALGPAMAIQGSQVLLGAQDDDTTGENNGAGYLFDVATATPRIPVRVLAARSPSSGDLFGAAVAIHGSLMVVGSWYDDTGQPDAGVAHVYDLAGSTPRVPILTLTNPYPQTYCGFGRAVAISGKSVVVSAPWDDTWLANAGAVYVYDLSSPTPVVPMLVLTNPAAGDDYFGISVAISGTRVLVGSPETDVETLKSGAAYLYDLTSPTPAVPILKLYRPGALDYDAFGGAVAIDGSRAIIGAGGVDAGPDDAGIAYVYDFAGPTPSLPLLVLTNPIPQPEGAFGGSVSIFGTRVAVGAAGNPGAVTTLAGRAFVFDLTAPTPAVPVLTLTNPLPTTIAQFALTIAVSSTHVVVSALANTNGILDGNQVFVYDFTSPTPQVPAMTLINPSPARGDRFGNSISISGNLIAIGAPFDDTGGVNCGAVYVYGRTPVLAITRGAPGTILLSWTPGVPGFQLLFKESVSATTWFDAPSGGANPVTVFAPNPQRIYRLVLP